MAHRRTIAAMTDRPPRPGATRMTRAALLLAMLVAALLAPVAPVGAGEATPLAETVQFAGVGYGHGVGLSQYGARGRALAGQDRATILGHYFAGTTIGTVDISQMVRVLVLDGYAATDVKPLVIVGHGAPWSVGGITGQIPAGHRLSVRPPLAGTTAWRLTVTDPAGAVIAEGTAEAGTNLRVATTDSAIGYLELKTKPSAYDEYRGFLRIHLGTTTMRVVNHVRIESYLRGVVPAEMPSSWPAAALEAQTVAARSYAVRRLHPSTGTFDLYDDWRNQVYLGRLAEKATTNGAIRTTAGEVVMSGTSIANTFFHSTGGCATEHNEYAWVSSTGKIVAGPLPYLRGSDDRAEDGTCYDAASPWATWQTKAYPLATVSAWFAADSRTNVGDLQALDLTRRGVSGRLISVTLIGSLGEKTVSGDVFRSIFNAARPSGDPFLRSNLFDMVPSPAG